MEILVAIAAVCLVGIQAHRNYLMVKNGSKPVVVNVPAPIVNVTFEAPESVPLAAIETVDYDYTYLEAILQQLVDLHKNQQVIPLIPNIPIPMPQYPTPPYITYGDSKTDNKIEINGVSGKQFPAR